MVAAHAVEWMIVVLFVLRLSGQGLMAHISQTSAARHFHADRGKALSVVSLGFPLSEAIVPTITVAAIALTGWRTTWTSAAFVGALILLPSVM